MLTKKNAYEQGLFTGAELNGITAEEITAELERYLEQYFDCFANDPQRKYFGVFQRGLLSDLERKSIEPIALSLLDETQVRSLQQFFRRAVYYDQGVKVRYQELLAAAISEADGFLSVDGSDFPKKGKASVGVARQYCGRLGKTENCQAGVFVSYATEQGYGLVQSQLYMPEKWFSEEFAEQRKKCDVPKDLRFQTKNEIALELIRDTINSGKFPVKWIGCDAAFGSDHNFLQNLPENVYYFASVREKELVFLKHPEMLLPEYKRGRPAKKPRPSEPPFAVTSVANDGNIPWEKCTLAMGTKGPVLAEVKCVRCVSCDDGMPMEEVWLYIRKYEDGAVKYFLSNASADTPRSVLDRLATMRWSIEQCFQECKSYLGMTHYETRTYGGWHRHMQMVMIAHLFTLHLRLCIQKNLLDYADGKKARCLRTCSFPELGAYPAYPSLSFEP